MAKGKEQKFIPALRFDWLTPVYDPMMRFVMREAKFKSHLIRQARPKGNERILDVGCGTGTLALLIKKSYPKTIVTGLDPDPKILQIAMQKALQAKADISYEVGFSNDLPYDDNSFDRVFSSMVFHHLTNEEKQKAALEIYRVLRPGGEFHIVDFGKPHNAAMFATSLIMRHLEENYGNVQGLIPEILIEAGFKPIEETAKYSTIFGTLRLYKAVKPV